MRYIEGNIWDLHEMGYPIVVPTNIGWRRDGTAIFGKGIAAECAYRFPKTTSRWGAICQVMDHKVTTYYDEEFSLFYFPTKPLNKEAPQLSWKSPADYDLIRKSLAVLIELVDQNKLQDVVTPLVGCGNGGLSPQQIKPLLEKNLDDRFILIRPTFIKKD